ncbi:type II CAAX endopeptidase family protein [Lacticaseibacillus pabuli]|uniref:Type II CAAX endopeptidase family protein n=1 Tax=Lacticaseibacillus pabuli TaxID=3025672 RepID=A0ABY7WQ88_9LACO|nr:type II CAAX endopeptidase family protein [Lacticaseibacillus sp. KACC 23028]WDF82349.1 type II CAAX endopeptidase family protein [Lacticaseibacillus sp. KACC 23028]
MRKNVLQRLVTVAAALVFYVIADIITLLPSQLKWDGATLFGIAFGILTFGGLIIWLWGRYRKFTEDVTPPDDMGRWHWRDVWSKVKGMLPGLLIMVVIQVISSLLITNHIIHESSNQTAIDALLKGNEWTMALETILLAPIVEELIFRGLLMNLAFAERNRATQTFNIILSAGAFSLAHGPSNIVDFLLYGGLGLGLAVTYARTKDLRCGIGLHILNNLIAFI